MKLAFYYRLTDPDVDVDAVEEERENAFDSLFGYANEQGATAEATLAQTIVLLDIRDALEKINRQLANR